MNATAHDKQIILSINPLEVAGYLRTKGWEQINLWEGRASIWENQEKEGEIVLPLSKELGDYSSRMNELLDTLSKLEQRSQLQILNDLLVHSADIVRIRLQTEAKSHNGTISLEDLSLAINHSKDLMLAAACAAIEPRVMYSSKKFTQATDYINKLRMAQTERGSYVLKIISRMSPSLHIQPRLFEEDVEEPFERQVTTTLMKSISRLAAATIQAGLKGDLEPLQQEIPNGVSANLCDAILGFSGVNQDSSFEIGISWSNTRRPPHTSLPNKIAFSADSLSIIQEASRIWKTESPQEEFELEGLVVSLARGELDSEGKVTIMGAVGSKLRKVATNLSRDVYELAISAHKDRRPIRVRGDLTKSGNLWTLQAPRHFQLLEESKE